MAIYQKDITKNIEPAMANPATMRQAGEYTRAAIGTLAEGAEAYYKGRVAKDMFDLEQEASALSGEFFVSNQAARVAGERATAFEATRPSPSQLEFAEGARGRQQEAKLAEQLDGFDTELLRLKNAAQGGMSNSQYVARIDSITKKAIAQYPGLADDIRDRVARTTGMSGADRWAQMEFVKDRFAKPKASTEPTELDMAVKDMAAVGPLGIVGSQQELFTLYNKDRPEYNRRMNEGRKILAIKTQNDVLQQQTASAKNQGDLQADQMSGAFNAMFSASLGASVLTSAVQDKEKIFATALKLRSEGSTPITDIEGWKTSIAVHNAEMRTNIELARSTALREVENYISNNAATLSEGKKKELRDSIIRQSDEALRMYADDKGVGLLAIANVLSTYRDKGIKEQQAIINLAIQQQTAMQNNPLVTQYYQGGAARERLKEEQPFFYNFMVKQEQQLTDNLKGIGNLMGAASSLSNVSKAIDAASKDPAAQEPPSDVPPEDVKASHAAMNAEMKQAVDKLAEGGLATTSEVNMISSTLSTDVLTGANSNVLEQHYNKWGELINRLPPKDIGIVKANVSNASINTISKIQGIKKNLEDVHGVKLTLGVNDAGQLLVIDESGDPANKGKFTKYAAAYKEMNNLAAPLVKNALYARSMLTGEDLGVISKEYATLINSGTPYKGFFSLKPKPVGANVEDAGISQQAPAAPMDTTEDKRRDSRVASTVEEPARGRVVEGKVTQTTKILSLADLKRYAKSKGMSLNDAMAQAKADGVTIGD